MIRSVVLFLMVFAFMALPASTALALETVYLDEKMAYCHTQDSLTEYLAMANQRNVHGMNLLVLSGECDFVADGDRLGFTNYRKTTIGDMPVIELNARHGKLWTFQSLLQTEAAAKLPKTIPPTP